MSPRNDVNFVPDDVATPQRAPERTHGHEPVREQEAELHPGQEPRRWRPQTPHERGISQEPVPAPPGPLVADVKMHDLPDTTDPVGHGSIWLAMGVLIFVVLLLAFLWAMYG